METRYFRDSWKPDYSKFKYSGWALLDKVKETDQILDIGCGYNLFKEKFGDRLYGIDPANDKADEVVSWEDYKPHKKFNVYFALGSLNFGTEQEVEHQVSKLSEITIDIFFPILIELLSSEKKSVIAIGVGLTVP